MIVGLGSDICNIERIEKAYSKFGKRFIKRCYGENEQKELELLVDNLPRYAASLAKRFAAKEGFVKALGTGFAHGVAWSEIEVVHHASGKPILKISGKAEQILKKMVPASRLWVSLSDDYPLAQAVVVIESC